MSARNSPVSPALQKLSSSLYPAWQLFSAPPASLQSLPHPDSQSRVSLALLKLPLGNLTPSTKPEMAELPTHTHKHTHVRTHTNTGEHKHMRPTHCVLNVGVTWLCSSCSLLRQRDKRGRYRWLSDRRFVRQEPIAV